MVKEIQTDPAMRSLLTLLNRQIMPMLSVGVHLVGLSKEFTWQLADKPEFGTHIRLIEQSRYVGQSFLNALANCLKEMSLPVILEENPGALRILDSDHKNIMIPEKKQIFVTMDNHWELILAEREDVRKSLEILNNLLSKLYPTPAEDRRDKKVQWRFKWEGNRKYPEASSMKLCLNCVQERRSENAKNIFLVSDQDSSNFLKQVRDSIAKPNSDIPEEVRPAEVPLMEEVRGGYEDDFRLDLIITGDAVAKEKNVFSSVLGLQKQMEYVVVNTQPQGVKAGLLRSLKRAFGRPTP